MICNSCKKEMNYFVDRQTCGWKCNYCDNIIVTTHSDEIELDETEYTISVSSIIQPSATQIKNIAEICNYSFIVAKEKLIVGGEIGTYDAPKTREVLRILQTLKISYTTSPKFIHKL